jgi:hypothetical protein
LALNTSNRVISWFIFSFRRASEWASSRYRYKQENAILTQHPGCLEMKSVILSQQLLHGENEMYISTRVAVLQKVKMGGCLCTFALKGVARRLAFPDRGFHVVSPSKPHLFPIHKSSQCLTPPCGCAVRNKLCRSISSSAM